jgi:F420-dependent oxidoreductase-like protein
MRVSASVTNFSWTHSPTGRAADAAGLAEPLAAVAQAADEAGLDTLWVADHLLQADPSSSVEQPMLEAYTTLGYLAARTNRVRLGTMVSAATFRSPALLIKAVTTLDVLSGGRAWLGLGAGYQQDEAEAMGLELPPVGQRFAVLSDILQLARRMWAGDDSAFHGQTVRAARPIGSPPPVTQPHPPILIGGTGKQRTLRLVAEYADACNVFDIPDGGTAVRSQLEVLAEHCADLGRDYNSIDRTISTGIAPDEPVDALVGRFARLGELGITHVIAVARGRPLTGADMATLGAAAAELRER